MVAAGGSPQIGKLLGPKTVRAWYRASETATVRLLQLGPLWPSLLRAWWLGVVLISGELSMMRPLPMTSEETTNCGHGKVPLCSPSRA